MELWEILVPTQTNAGKPIRTRFHRVWDKRVYQIAGGITIHSPSKGKWVSPAGGLFQERMIPVRIACTREQIELIVDATIEHYDQEAVMAYKVSDEVFIKHRKA